MKRSFICISIIFLGVALFAEKNSDLPRYKGFAIGGDVFGQVPIGDYSQFANANIGLSLAGEYTFPLNLPMNMDLGAGIRAEYGHVFPKSNTSLKSDEEIRAFANIWLRIPFKLFNQYFAFQPEVGGGLSNFFTKYQIDETEKNGTYLSPFISIAPSLRWIPSALQNLEVELAPLFTIVPEKEKTTNMLGLWLGAIWHFEMKNKAVVDEISVEEKRKAKEAKKAEKAEKARLAEEEKKRREEEKEKARLEEEERRKREKEERLAEEERLAAEKAEKARIAAEEEEKSRLAAEEEAARLAAEEAEKKRLAEEEAARQAEEEAKLAEEAEKERLAEEKRLADEAEKQRLEKERLAAEERKRAEERIAAEEAEKARLAEEEAKRAEEAEKAEKARIAAEEEEKARLAAEEEAKRLAAEEAEKERLAAEEESEPVEEDEDETEEYAPTSVRLGLKNILFFSKNGAVFSGLSRRQIAQNERTIDEAVALIKEHPGCHVLIEGYANNISGTEKENRTACMPLSLWRAEYIKKELIKRGIKAEQIETVGRGEANPLAGRKDRNNWWKNRRVEFVITY